MQILTTFLFVGANITNNTDVFNRVIINLTLVSSYNGLLLNNTMEQM